MHFTEAVPLFTLALGGAVAAGETGLQPDPGAGFLLPGEPCESASPPPGGIKELPPGHVP